MSDEKMKDARALEILDRKASVADENVSRISGVKAGLAAVRETQDAIAHFAASAQQPAAPDDGEWPAGVLNRAATIELLTTHNEWRRYARDEQTDPRMLGLALDAAIAALRQQSPANRTALPAVTARDVQTLRACAACAESDGDQDAWAAIGRIEDALAAYDPAKAVGLPESSQLWKVVDRILVNAYTSAINDEPLDMLAARSTFMSAYAEANGAETCEDDSAHRMWCIVGEEVTTDTMTDLVAQAIEYKLVDADGKIRAEEWVRLRKVVIGPDDDDRLAGMANESMAGIFDRPVVPDGGKGATS